MAGEQFSGDYSNYRSALTLAVIGAIIGPGKWLFSAHYVQQTDHLGNRQNVSGSGSAGTKAATTPSGI
jgi:hypothetical protein